MPEMPQAGLWRAAAFERVFYHFEGVKMGGKSKYRGISDYPTVGGQSCNILTGPTHMYVKSYVDL